MTPSCLSSDDLNDVLAENVANWMRDLAPEVTARLTAEGEIERPGPPKLSMHAVQAAFNGGTQDTGGGPTQISQILAMSV